MGRLARDKHSSLQKAITYTRKMFYYIGHRSVAFNTRKKNIFLFYKTSYLNEEANGTEPSPPINVLGKVLNFKLGHIGRHWMLST